MKETCIATRRLSLNLKESGDGKLCLALKPKLEKVMKVLENTLWPIKSSASLYPKSTLAKDKLDFNKWKIKSATIDLLLCGPQKMKTVNRSHRGKDYATDVLSFPMYQTLRGNPPKNEFVFSPAFLGDIIVCKNVAKKQAKEFGISQESEIIHLVVHGLLHLCGYDHDLSKKEETLMFHMEEKIVERIFKKIGE